jgi:hypothetical protein
MSKYFFFIALAFVALKLTAIQDAKAEAGMIPFDAPVGEIGGRGHWYSLRTMKGKDYWKDPAVSSDIRDNEDGTYSITGEIPVSVVLVLHPDFYRDNEPWRHAIDWIRQAEQMYRNSGVPVRFIIEHISVWEDMPDTTESAYHNMPFDKYAKYGGDLVLGLINHLYGDPYCGIAGINSRLSVSGCNPITLAHEIGHNFGLHHAHAGGRLGEKGSCVRPSPGARECTKGTIMSYAGRGRIPLFAANGFEYEGEPLGDEEHTAVEFLRKWVASTALKWEQAQNNVEPPELSSASLENEEVVYCN